MERIHIHWTAGSHNVGAADLKHYHFIVAGNGLVANGSFRPEDNLDTSTPYAAHTKGANTGAIGIAVAAMHGAKERPFSAGKYPITHAQYNSLIDTVADLATKYGIPVDRRTILTHAEIEPTLGIKQRGKWDITWLPGMTGVGDPVVVGDRIRSDVAAVMTPSKPQSPTPATGGFWAWLKRLFGGK